MVDFAVVGGGVVGTAVALTLARRGAGVVLLEAKGIAAGASGANSGLLHVAFDSPPGELETELILRSAQLRDPVIDALGIPVRRCGALVRDGRGGTFEVADEAVTDPAAYTRALAAAAEACGAEIRTGFRLTDRREVPARVTVNCAGLYADEVARLFGDDSFEIFPRKGEFAVFDGLDLDRVLFPAPDPRTRGVLVFPTVDGKVIAGPTAVDQTDKEDRTVRPQAVDEIRRSAAELLPAIADAEPIATFAGLRPAGRGCNYLIRRHGDLVNVAAIRSTGLSACHGIAEHVAELLLPGADERPLPRITLPPAPPWWAAAT
jgi:glycerol-3-phosphate dehydrogenase